MLHLVLALLLAALLAALLLGLRLLLILPHGNAPPPRVRRSPASAASRSSASLAVFLGSGGHTAEMRTLLSAVDFARYSPRIYVYGAGDDMSLRAVGELERRSVISGQAGLEVLALPRARRVGEGKLSTIVSASRTFAVAFWHAFLVPLWRRPREPWVDVLVLNGPGTGFVLAVVCYIRRILGLSYTRIVYVESFARVKSLSLSGKLLRPFVDRFVVQWPDAAGPSGVEMRSDRSKQPPASKGATYRGWLV